MSIHFDSGSTDRVDISPDATIDTLAEFYDVFWLYKDNSGSTATHELAFAKSTSHFLNVRSTIDLRADYSTGNITAEASPSLGSGWHYIAAGVYDDGSNFQGEIYLGNLTTAAAKQTLTADITQPNTASRTDDSANNLTLGNHFNGTTSLPFLGRLGFYQRYNRRLLAGEIKQLQFNPFPLSGCVVNYPLPSLDSLSTIRDYSGNGNDGTGTGLTRTAPVPIGNVWGNDIVVPFPVTATSPSIAVFRRRIEARNTLCF